MLDRIHGSIESLLKVICSTMLYLSVIGTCLGDIILKRIHILDGHNYKYLRLAKITLYLPSVTRE